MNHSPEQNLPELSTSRLFSRLLQWLRVNRFSFFAALLFGLFSYMFTLTNKLVNSDDLYYMFTKGATISSGRWGLDLLSLVLPDVSMPWFHGILTILLFACGICLLLQLLQIRSHLLQVLTAGLIISFPSLTGTMGYMFTTSSYGAAFLLAVCTALFWSRRGWKNSLIGAVLCILSLSIYQAYISVTASLLVMLLIRETMYEDTPVKKLFLRGLGFVGLLALSLGLYWILTGLLQKLFQVPMNSYAEIAFNDTDQLLLRPVQCIRICIYGLLTGYMGLIHQGPSQLFHLVCLAVLALEILFWALDSRKAGRIGMLLFLLLLFPFAITSIVLFVSMDTVHTLVLLGFADIYVLMALIAENSILRRYRGKLLNRLRSWLLDALVLSMACITFINCSTANRASFNLYMRYENIYSMTTSLVSQIQSVPGFTRETPVAIVGYLPVTNDYDEIMDVKHIAGVSGLNTRMWHVNWMMMNYCGADFNFLDQEESLQFVYNQAFKDMPFFPDQGCVRMIDGTVVLKLDPWLLPGKYFSRIELPQ